MLEGIVSMVKAVLIIRFSNLVTIVAGFPLGYTLTLTMVLNILVSTKLAKQVKQSKQGEFPILLFKSLNNHRIKILSVCYIIG